MGGGAQERAEHVFLVLDHAVLRWVCSETWMEKVFACFFVFCVGLDVKADAGDSAVCFVAVGLLAAESNFLGF